MKTVTTIRTNDGKPHISESDARKHLEKCYADLLLPLAHKLVAVEKYSAMAEMLDASTETMRSLLAIKDELAAGVESEES